ncbi:hypothetical protein J2X03_003814 [Microbacterium trichothecenolyticum]|uniref:hypothetical protein n=1 Tax=Microbacterium trichothecenolyticum TaxID=69370 RepID=UPI002861C4F5|nr:hypothetical protein [Microbacterium trichothecenolyticum]MDR7113912.1 hypothetical protein [Microbacterium trichothecenolyticum]
MSDQTETKALTVEAARAAVQASGELEAIDGPHFLAHDEAQWLSYFLPSQSATGLPILARVIVTRRGQAPREVAISWGEYADEMQNDPAWNVTRERKPMTVFGAEVERTAYRRVFADVLAPLLGSRPAAPAAPPAERDWAAEIAAAATVDAINKIEEDGRAAKVFKPNAEGTALHRAVRDRRKELEAQAAAAWEPAELAQVADVTPERAAEVLRVAAEIDPVIDEAIAEAAAEEESAPGPSADAQGPATPERLEELARGIETHQGQLDEWQSEVMATLAPARPGRAPQDHLPKNRAERRAAARRDRRK